MKKTDIILKFQNNNNKLEIVLNEKNFSFSVKNLLLSMQYNINSAYNEYERIKVNVESKNKFTQNIIKMIENLEDIELVNLTSEEGTEFQKERNSLQIRPIYEKDKSNPYRRSDVVCYFQDV